MVTFLEISPPTKLTKQRCTDPVYIFSQFFIHKDETRNDEIKYCLKQNVENAYIKEIVLLMNVFIVMMNWVYLVRRLNK